MQNIKKYFMTLALLLTAVTGAWAQNPNAVTAAEINADVYSGWTSIDEELFKASELPGFQAVTEDQAKSWTGAPSTGTVKLFYEFVADGHVKVVIFKDGVYDESYEENDLTCYLIYEDIKYNGDTKYFYTTGPAPTEWSLTPDETGKTWTLAEMPASNVELQVEYYAESNLFLGKEALADKTNISVLNGETAVEFGDDGKSANTVTEGTEVTVKFTGKKVLGMKVEKKAPALLSIEIGGHVTATIYYFEGETWEQAIQNHPTENSAWKINQGYISGQGANLFAGGNYVIVNPNDTIDPKAEYHLMWT